ncbi:MAG TPA: peroxidase family protein [Pyrinomonadaceae bacterium]
MIEPGAGAGLDSNIPSAYTYLGQFVDHDVTLMAANRVDPNDTALAPMSPAQISAIRNRRTPWLDLDSLYSEAPQDAGGDMLTLGRVTTHVPPRPPGKGDDFLDVPRRGRKEHIALIGDVRNDETTIISQLHAAFLRAHNVIVASGYRYCEARSLLRRYYQTVVLHDFLRQVADRAVVDRMLDGPWDYYNPDEAGFFMPFEFNAAAFRFGHSMVRGSYGINDNFTAQFAPLFRLFNVFGRYATLPENWLIRWENFVEGGPNRARLIDTRLAAPLHTLPTPPPGPPSVSLPVLTLLRGYVLSLPTGQAIAGALGLSPAERLTDADIEAVGAGVGLAQLDVLRKERVADDGAKWKLSARTPLWFYILAEAAHFKGGQCLGPVGSLIVAGVLVALARRSRDSVLTLPSPGPQQPRESQFNLRDLLRLARVL